jgi:hypothetical protein
MTSENLDISNCGDYNNTRAVPNEEKRIEIGCLVSLSDKKRSPKLCVQVHEIGLCFNLCVRAFLDKCAQECIEQL